jgi:hypothetical protein
LGRIGALKPQLLKVGISNSPIVIIDDFTGDSEDVARLADELAPFPPMERNYYPGLRRVITPVDGKANSYVVAACERAAPFIGGAFDVTRFDLDEASFSLVTLKPHELQPVQKAPHFDSPDQNVFALLHYLRVPPQSGTAFYRHRATGIERITAANLDHYVAAAKREQEIIASRPGYFSGSDQFYEEIGRVGAVADRVLIYHGSLLHSGIIPAGMNFNADPKKGRLTANFFLRALSST